MAIKTNSFYADPGMGAGIENLGRAIFGNPEDRIKMALADAQGRYYGARSEEAQADADRKRAALKAAQTIGTDIGNALFAEAPGPNLDGSAGVPMRRAPDEIRRSMPIVLNRAATAYADKPDALGQIFALIGAMSGDDALARQGMVATGKTPGEHFAITPERADGIRKQGFDAQYTREIDQENIREGGRMARRYDNPVEMDPDKTYVFRPGDVRTPKAAVPQGEGLGSLFVNPDPSPRPDKFVVSPVEGQPGKFTYEPVSKGLPAPTPAGERPRDPKNAPKMTPKDLEGIETRIAEGLGIKAEKWADLIGGLDPADRAALSDAISQAWANSHGSAPDAIAEGQRFLTERYDVAPGTLYGINVNKKQGAKQAPAKPAKGAPKGGAPAPQPGAKPTPQQLIDEANEAIAKGANPAAVRKRLEEMGVKLAPST
jgi:hypothetical protein